MTSLGVVLVTAASEAEALKLAETLVQEKLAACVNLLPVRSVYTWQGELQRDNEYQLIIKTRLDRFEQLAERVRALHSYEVPEIIGLPITHGTPDYLGWLSEQTETLQSRSSVESP